MSQPLTRTGSIWGHADISGGYAGRRTLQNIFHIYMTDGWLEFQAYKNEKKVLCISHNPEAAAERLRAMIEEHEKKKQKKKNNR